MNQQKQLRYLISEIELFDDKNESNMEAFENDFF